MNFKPKASLIGLVIVFLCLFAPLLPAQTQPEALENVLVLQKNGKEWVGQTGDYLVVKVYNRLRGYAGRLNAITDSTVTVRRKTFKLDELKRVTVGKRRLHIAALSLGLVGMLGPYVVGGFISLFEAISGPPSFTSIRPNFWRNYRTSVSIITLSALTASIVTNIIGNKRFNLKHHSIKVEQRNRVRH